MCQAVDSNSQWPVSDQALSTVSLGQAAFCRQYGAPGGVSHEERSASSRWALSQLPSAAINLYLFPSWGPYLLLRGRDHLIYLYILHVAQGPGFSSYHGRCPMNVCQLGSTSYAIARQLGTRTGNFTRCYFAKNIPEGNLMPCYL